LSLNRVPNDKIRMTEWPSEKISVRALVLHVPLRKGDESFNTLKAVLDDKLSLFNESVEAFSRSMKVKVFTKRLVLGIVDQKVLTKLITRVEDFVDDYEIDYYAIPILNISDPKNLVITLQEHPKLFTSIKYRDSLIGSIIEVLHNFAERTWIGATHFAVSFGGLLQTPYFPATTATHEGITVSLLYPSYFMDNIDNFNEIYNSLSKINKIFQAGTPMFRGIDYSLSPWMEESVARLIEQAGNASFTHPGTINGIVKVNNMLEELSRRLGGIGYNEVMLPLGEDDRLKQLARENQLKFSHLLNYTAYCVAGLDMIPIPASTEEHVLRGIISDLNAIYSVKRRVLGMRLIPVGADEGEEVDLGMFGNVPVLSPLF